MSAFAQPLGRFVLPPMLAVGATTLALWQGRFGLGEALFLAMTLIYMTTRACLTDGTPSPEQGRNGPSDRWLLFVVAAGMYWLPLIAIASPWLDFAAYPAPQWALWAGCALAMAGLLLFWRAHADLGSNCSPVVELRSDQKLVTEGIYLFHPG